MTTDQYKKWYFDLLEKYEKASFKILQKGFGTILNKSLKGATENNYKDKVKKGITEKAVFDVILSLYTVVGTAQGKKILQGIENNTITLKAVNPLFGKLFAEAVLLYLQTYGGDKIKTMTQTFIDAVIQFLGDKIASGEPLNRTIHDLEDNFGDKTGLYYWQLERISRTETASASNYASWKALESDRLIIDKVWIATNDHRTRDGDSKNEYDHIEMDGVTLPKDVLFKVQNQNGDIDEIMYPVDPIGHPSNTINCRCTIAPKPRRDKNGKLILKT